MRDVISIPFQDKESLIIASDNSGAIGMKEHDHVQVSYETVGYFSFRVAAMECIAAGGEPVSVILQNFCGNESWSALVNGIQKGLTELNRKDVMITGSTESNFHLRQSAVGLSVLGRKPVDKKTELVYSEQLQLAVIGLPLVGNEVIEQHEKVVPLSLFQKICNLKEVMVWPVGSKGILFELNQMFPNQRITPDRLRTMIDVLKSSGPATCFIVVYHPVQEEEIRQLTSEYFHSIKIKKE